MQASEEREGEGRREKGEGSEEPGLLNDTMGLTKPSKWVDDGCFGSLKTRLRWLLV